MAWFRRLRNTLFGARLDRDALEEMRFHVAERAADYRREGMTEAEARRAASRRLGNATLLVDRVRDVDTLRWLGSMTVCDLWAYWISRPAGP